MDIKKKKKKKKKIWLNHSLRRILGAIWGAVQRLKCLFSAVGVQQNEANSADISKLINLKGWYPSAGSSYAHFQEQT